MPASLKARQKDNGLAESVRTYVATIGATGTELPGIHTITETIPGNGKGNDPTSKPVDPPATTSTTISQSSSPLTSSTAPQAKEETTTTTIKASPTDSPLKTTTKQDPETTNTQQSLTTWSISDTMSTASTSSSLTRGDIPSDVPPPPGQVAAATAATGGPNAPDSLSPPGNNQNDIKPSAAQVITAIAANATNSPGQSTQADNQSAKSASESLKSPEEFKNNPTATSQLPQVNQNNLQGDESINTKSNQGHTQESTSTLKTQPGPQVTNPTTIPSAPNIYLNPSYNSTTTDKKVPGTTTTGTSTSIPSGGGFLQISSTSAINGSSSSSSSTPSSSSSAQGDKQGVTTDPPAGKPTAGPLPTLTPLSEQTFITLGTTLTGAAAASAIAAAASGTGEVKSTTISSDGGSKLSSFAIVGIVAGCIVAIIIVYVVWYNWRKKRISDALGDQSQDDSQAGEYLEKPQQREIGDRTAHSGFDFIDDPYGQSRASRNGDPFDDQHQSTYGSTWYQRPQQPVHTARPESALEEYVGEVDELAANLYTAAPANKHTRRVSDPVDNPFASNNEYYHHEDSTRRVSDSQYYPRPDTDYTRAESVNYGDIYGEYSDSRPGTQYSSRDASQTPSTSALLPWLQEPAPPVPAVPRDVVNGHRPGGDYEYYEGEDQGYEEMYDQGDDRRVRQPPRAMMAKTPMPNGQGGGFSDAVPQFR